MGCRERRPAAAKRDDQKHDRRREYLTNDEEYIKPAVFNCDMLN